ncbi:MAG: hypothetical protein GY756_25450 [bacterium]|nr:hypothetical protein [bacterium]
MERSKFIIDKITLLVKKEIIKSENKRFYSDNELTQIDHGSHCKLHIHDKYFKDKRDNITTSIIKALDDFYNSEHPIFNVAPYYYSECIRGDIFKLSEIEIAYDFYGSGPFMITDKSNFNNPYPTTFYTLDYWVEPRSGGRPGTKKTHDSLICIYDRGVKIKSKYPITRFEYRIKDKYVKNISLQDLNTKQKIFMEEKLLHILPRFTRKLIPQNAFKINWDYAKCNCPDFYLIMKESFSQDTDFVSNF